MNSFCENYSTVPQTNYYSLSMMPFSKQTAPFCLLLIFSLGMLASAKPTAAQKTDPYKLHIGLSAGYGSYKLYDQLLNRYTYTGNTAMPLQLNAGIAHKQNQICLAARGGYSRMNPIHLNNTVYRLNHIRYRYYAFALHYLWAINPTNNQLAIKLGIACHTDLHAQTQYYDNLLFDYGRGYRQSYKLSALSLSPSLRATYQLNPKNQLTLNAYYAPFSLAARPNDDYVKRTKSHQGAITWQNFGPKTYQAYQLTVVYHRQLTAKLSTNIRAIHQKQHYQYVDVLKLQQNLLLIGIERQF